MNLRNLAVKHASKAQSLRFEYLDGQEGNGTDDLYHDIRRAQIFATAKDPLEAAKPHCRELPLFEEELVAKLRPQGEPGTVPAPLSMLRRNEPSGLTNSYSTEGKNEEGDSFSEPPKATIEPPGHPAADGTTANDGVQDVHTSI